MKFNGKVSSITEQAGAISGGLTGFGITNLIFIGEILGIANKGGDVIAQWSSAVDETEKKTDAIVEGLSRGKGVGSNNFVSNYVSDYGVDFKFDITIASIGSLPKFNVGDLALGGLNFPKASKILPLKYGGFKQGSESGITYLRELNPNKKTS